MAPFVNGSICGPSFDILFVEHCIDLCFDDRLFRYVKNYDIIFCLFFSCLNVLRRVRIMEII